MTFLSLFSGCGGMDLGLERAGFRCIGQVEIIPERRAMLARHWPDVPKFDDVRTFNAKMLNEKPDLIAGGFPCQDISSSGKKVGITGAKSGLWKEFARILRQIRPRFALVENVSMLTSRAGGLGVVLQDLAECGLDAEWETLPAGLFGAPHIRARTFLVGYSNGDSKSDRTVNDEAPWLPPMVANAEHAFRAQRGALGRAWGMQESVPWDSDGKCTDSTLAVRVDDGISYRMERLAALGDAVVPQVAEFIGRRIMEAVNNPHPKSR
jgi:DNA (cytosine-5)-methyltransferase 1